MLSYILYTATNLNVTGIVVPPLVIIGGGCPTKTEMIAKLSKFLYALEVKYMQLYVRCICAQSLYQLVLEFLHALCIKQFLYADVY